MSLKYEPSPQTPQTDSEREFFLPLGELEPIHVTELFHICM